MTPAAPSACRKHDHTAQDAYALERIAALPVGEDGWLRPRFRDDLYGEHSRPTFMRCVARLAAAGYLLKSTPVASARLPEGYQVTEAGRDWLNRFRAQPEPALNRVSEPAPEPVLDSSPLSTSVEEKKKEGPDHPRHEPATLNRLPEPAIGLLAGLSKRDRERVIGALERAAEGVHLLGLAAAARESARPEPERCGCGKVLAETTGPYGPYPACPNRKRCPHWKARPKGRPSDHGGPRVDPRRAEQEKAQREKDRAAAIQDDGPSLLADPAALERIISAASRKA